MRLAHAALTRAFKRPGRAYNTDSHIPSRYLALLDPGAADSIANRPTGHLSTDRGPYRSIKNARESNPSNHPLPHLRKGTQMGVSYSPNLFLLLLYFISFCFPHRVLGAPNSPQTSVAKPSDHQRTPAQTRTISVARWKCGLPTTHRSGHHSKSVSRPQSSKP